MEEVKYYKNKDLIGQSYAELCDSVKNDFIDQDFISELEWGMLLTKSAMKQIHFSNGNPLISINHFDKAHLFGNHKDGLISDEKYSMLPHGGNYQAGPDIFPLINIRIINLGGESVQLLKVRELSREERRHLMDGHQFKHLYAISWAYYDKKKDSWYGAVDGRGVNPAFFSAFSSRLGSKESFNVPINLLDNLFGAVSLNKDAVIPKVAFKEWLARNSEFSSSLIITEINQILLSYQVALTDFYNWQIYLKEQDNLGFVIPVDPIILPELYKSSTLKFESHKAMLHFVKDHYRRKVADDFHDYSVYVQKYLRGENKFIYRGFRAEIIPPKYELNRVKTKKVFTEINN